MQVIAGKDAKQDGLIRCSIDAPGSHRKTTIATRLPEEWGELLYIAADPTSPFLESVLPEDRARMQVIVPDGGAERDPKTGIIRKTDWRKEAYEIAQIDWKERFPNIGVCIWDTMTHTAEEILRENARKNWFSEKGPVQGSNNPNVEGDQKYALPQEGDYRMAQQSMLQIIEWFNRQKTHVICLFQQAMSESNARSGEGLLFGPATVGSRGPRQIPNKFGAVFYLSIDQGVKDGGTGDTIIHMIPEQYHVAGLKSVKLAEIPAVKKIGKDPKEARDFWRWVLQMKKWNPEVATVVSPVQTPSVAVGQGS